MAKGASESGFFCGFQCRIPSACGGPVFELSSWTPFTPSQPTSKIVTSRALPGSGHISTAACRDLRTASGCVNLAALACRRDVCRQTCQVSSDICPFCVRCWLRSPTHLNPEGLYVVFLRLGPEIADFSGPKTAQSLAETLKKGWGLRPPPF